MRIPGASLKMHKIEPDLLLIANIAPRRKKGSKSKKMPKRPVTKYH
jgi:hypothetical protein